jgi:hypothetical protein
MADDICRVCGLFVSVHALEKPCAPPPSDLDTFRAMLERAGTKFAVHADDGDTVLVFDRGNESPAIRFGADGSMAKGNAAVDVWTAG